MSIDNVIGSYGICNTASFNVLDINDEQVVGGINVLTIEDSSVYDIEWGLFDEDGEFVEPVRDGDYEYNTTRSYIMVNDLHIFIDEIERIKF